MRAAVRLVAVGFEISEENRPKRVSARIDQGRREMFSEYAIALVLDLDDPVLNPYQLAVPRGPPVCQISLSQTTPKGIQKTPYCRTKPLNSRMSANPTLPDYGTVARHSEPIAQASGVGTSPVSTYQKLASLME